MRPFKLMFAASVLTLTSLPAVANEAVISVLITLNTQQTGAVVVSLYDSANSFLKSPIQEVTAMHDGSGVVELNLGNYPAGQYAISAFHDKNGNGKLDRNIFRIPSEPIGLSNNARPKFGPPKWPDASFSIAQSDHTVELSIGNSTE